MMLRAAKRSAAALNGVTAKRAHGVARQHISVLVRGAPFRGAAFVYWTTKNAGALPFLMPGFFGYVL